MTKLERTKRALRLIEKVHRDLAYGPQHGPPVTEAIDRLCKAQAAIETAWSAIKTLEEQPENPNCDGCGPHCAGEVRLLPTSTDPMHGNMILCRNCYNREIDEREQRNLELTGEDQYPLPVWNTLTVYGKD